MKKILLITILGTLFAAGNAFAHCGACAADAAEKADKIECKAECKKCCGTEGKCCKSECKSKCEGKKCCGTEGKCCKEKCSEEKADDTAAKSEACCPGLAPKPA